jgi:uncharacterized protein (DUF3084 family)
LLNLEITLTENINILNIEITSLQTQVANITSEKETLEFQNQTLEGEKVDLQTYIDVLETTETTLNE